MYGMSARLRSSTTELEEMGEETTYTTSKLRELVKSLTGVDIQKDENTFKSIYTILLEIGKEWKNLTDVEQASLSESLFGKRNSQVGFAILNNVDRLQEIYGLAENSAGSAMEEQEKYLEGVQYRIDQFRASVENLSNTVMSSDFLKGTIKLGTDFVNLLDTIVDKLGTIPLLVTGISTAFTKKANIIGEIKSQYELFNKQISLTGVEDLETFSASGSLSNVKALLDEYTSAARNADGVSRTFGKTQDELREIFSRTNTPLYNYIVNQEKLAQEGKAADFTIQGFAKSLRVAKIEMLKAELGAMALQAAISMGITVAISALIKLVDKLVVTTEEAIKAGEEAQRTVDDINDSFTKQQDLVKNSAQRFAELSQGVDQLTGKNVSLSDEDYKEFLDISNQLVEVFPTLSHHYDENGNAIADLDGDVNTITTSLNNLLEVEKKLSNQKILENADDVFAGIKGKVKNTFRESGADIFTDNPNEYSKYWDMLMSVGVNDLSDLTKDNLDKLAQEYGKEFPEFINQLNNLYKEAMSNYDSLLPYISTYLFEDYNFTKLSPQLQSGIQQMLSNVDWNSIDGLDNWEDVTKWIDNNILSALNNNDELAASFKVALEGTTKFNNGEISYSEYQEKLQNIVDLLDSLDLGENGDEIKKAIKLTLGIDTDSNGDIINTQANNLKKQIQKSLGKAYDEGKVNEIVGGLKIDTISSLQDSKIDWSEVINLSDLYDSVKNVENEARKLSQVPFSINLNEKDITTATSGIKELQSTFQTLYDNMKEGKEGTDLAFLMSDLDGLKSKLVDADGQFAVSEDTWNSFFDTLSDGSHTYQEMKDSLDQVLTEYVTATVNLENFDKAQADAISTQLQLAGITKESADEFVSAMSELAEATKMASDEGYELSDITSEVIEELVNEGKISEETGQRLALLAIQKQIANGLVIRTDADVANLQQLMAWADLSSESLQRLIRLKQLMADYESGKTILPQARLDNIRKAIEETETITQDEINAKLSQYGSLSHNEAMANKGSKSGSGGKESDPWKEAYEKELAALDHLHEMELVSDIQYYEEREKLNNKYFKDRKKYTEDYNKNLEEIYKGFQSAYKQYVDDMMSYWNKSLEAGKISFKDYCNNIKSMLDTLHDSNKINDETYYSKLSEYYGSVISNYDKVISAVQRKLKHQIDDLNKQKEAIKKNYEARIKSIQDEIDALNKANDARKKELDLQKALYELNRAQNQRKDYVYTSDKGFIYQANDADIRNAQQDLEDKKFEMKISDLQDQIESLQDEMNNLTDKIDAQIDKIQEYSDKWGEVANKFKEQQEDMIAAAVLGSDWQNEILALNGSVLAEFTNNYISMQQQQADAAVSAANVIVAAYNKQIEALNSWKEAQAKAEKTGGTSSLNKMSVNTDKSNTPVKSTTNAKAKQFKMPKKGNNPRNMAYGTGTKNAEPGFHEIAEDGNEIVVDNYGNAYLAEGRQLHRFEGGETVYDEKDTKELLKGKYIPIDSLFPDYTELLSKFTGSLSSISTNNASHILNSKNNIPPMINQDNSISITIGDINVSEVESVTSLAKAIKNQLPTVLLQELNKK